MLILGVEYLFCHCWNWNRERKPEMTWLSVDEITQGRQYRERTGPDGRPERYDGGIGFTIESVRQACHLGVVSGLLVRRQIHTPSGGLGDEQFTLRMRGMPQGDKYRFFSHSVEFGDLSALFAPVSDSNRLSAPAARLDTPDDRLSAPAPRQGAPASRLDAPGDRPSAPAERLDAPLYRPSSVPAVSDLQNTPAEQPATTPTSIAATAPANPIGQAQQDVVVVDTPGQVQELLKQIAGAAAPGAILTLYRAQIEREATIVAIGRWLTANRVFESTRRNIISAHPESITILRAIAEFECTDSQGATDPVAWGRKVGGIFKQAARVVALANGFEIRAGQILRDTQRQVPVRPAAVSALAPDQVIMIDLLGWQGFSANDARRLALGYHDGFERAALAQLAGWVDYVLTQGSLHSPLAYLRKCLEQLDKPPAARGEGPAMDFWSWREELLGEAPLPLKHPAVDYAAFTRRQEQIQLAQTQLSTAGEQAANLQQERERLDRESLAPERLGREEAPPVADPLEQRVSDFFGPEVQRVLDFVEMRQWRGVIAQAFARHPSLAPVFAQVQVNAVDRESRTATIQLRGADTLEAGRFAVAELPRVMEHCAIGLSLDPAQAEPGLIELLAHWREVVREYRAQFGALSSVPADAHSHVPISMLWPLRVEDDVIEIGLLTPAEANAPAQAWLSGRMSELAERPVVVRGH